MLQRIGILNMIYYFPAVDLYITVPSNIVNIGQYRLNFVKDIENCEICLYIHSYYCATLQLSYSFILLTKVIPLILHDKAVKTL